MLLHLAVLLVGLGPQVQAGGSSSSAAPIVRPAPQTPPRGSFVPSAHPQDDLDKAQHAAAVDNIRVLIVWGNPSDPRTASFPRLVKLPDLATPSPLFSSEYRPVNIDVGNADKNLDLAAKYGVTLAAADLPVLTVLDAAGKTVISAAGSAFRQAGNPDALDPNAIGAFLTKHRAIASDPNADFEAARKQAKAQDKLVFVWFSAPW